MRHIIALSLLFLLTICGLTSAQDEWYLEFLITGAELSDHTNRIGVSQTASDGWDVMDVLEPPQFGDVLSLYFPHLDWQSVYAGRYMFDIREPLAEGETKVWFSEIQTTLVETPIVISWDSSAVPNEHSVFLNDLENGNRVDMMLQSQYSHMSDKDGGTHYLSVEVGFKTAAVAEKDFFPSAYSLAQNYPNPFNSSTQINFSLSKPTQIQLDIFSVLGTKIKTLQKGKYNAGVHLLTWDGKDAHGEPMVSGIYFYVLKTTEFTANKRMIILR